MSNFLNEEFIQTLNRDAKSVWPVDFFEITTMFNRCCLSMSYYTIRQLGLFQKKNDSETFSSIQEKINCFKDAEYLFKMILNVLCEEKVLEKEGDIYRCIETDLDISTPAEILVEAVRTFPHEGAAFQWLARAYDGMFRFIKGEAYAEEVMFPWGSFQLVEEVYNTSHVYGFYSLLAGKAIKRILESYFNTPVTFLEIGAGTGNGTQNVFNETTDQFEKYVYTDISKALIKMAKTKFKSQNLNFVDYRSLDINKDPIKQGFEANNIDIVLAVNVLHATNNLERSLRNIHQLLKKGGWLILSEIAPPLGALYRYMELTFGMLSSYAVYEDTDVRPISAIIRPEDWKKLFERTGFHSITSIPGKAFEDIDRGGLIVGIK